MSLDREDMRRRGRIGALVTRSRHDGRSLTAPAREAFRGQFVADARALAESRGEVISDSEAERRAESARRAHYVRMARASVLARARRRSASTPEPA